MRDMQIVKQPTQTAKQILEQQIRDWQNESRLCHAKGYHILGKIAQENADALYARLSFHK